MRKRLIKRVTSAAQTCRWLTRLVVLVSAVAVSISSAAVGPIDSVTVENPDGTIPYDLLSITVGRYTVEAGDLVVGTTTTGLDPGAGQSWAEMDNLDIHDAIDTGQGTSATTVLFGGENWKDTNGDNPDFFLFESHSGNSSGDNPEVAAILPDGTIGQSITLAGSDFGPTGYFRVANAPDGMGMSGQQILGIAFSITDLSDAGGAALTTDSEILGIALTNRGGADITCLCASVGPLVEHVKAAFPDPADGAVGVEMPLLQWTAGDTARFHDVYLGTSPELGPADLVMPRSTATVHWHAAGVDPGVTYYWRVDEIEADMVTVHAGDVWSFTVKPAIAWAPDPADGATQIVQTPTLAWMAGQGALEHHLYFGADADAVGQGTAETDKGALVGDVTTYQITDSLDIGTTYYWRVDTKDLAGTVQTGEVWSFTTIAPGPGGAIRQWWLGVTGTDLAALTDDARYPDEPDGEELVLLMEGPVTWADNYGSRLYGWLYPRVSGDYTFWLSSDDAGELRLSPDADPDNAVPIASVATYTGSREWNKEAGQVSGPQSLVAGQRYYIEAVMNEGTGGDNIAVAWQGPGVPFEVIGSDVIAPIAVYPLRAFAPSPADGAVDTIQAPTLSWFAGENAQQHDVYVGDDAEAVANADPATADIYRGSLVGTSYNPGPLEWDKTYFWRIDEKEADGTVRTGAVWSFTTANFILIDDFESYTNEVGQRVFEVWVDGIGFSAPPPGHPGNGSGAAVGHDIWSTDSPHYNGLIMETGIVHGGNQSMPVSYDNTATPFYSEIERTWAPPQDWTVNGVDTVVIHIYGDQNNGAGQLYVLLEDSAGRTGLVAFPEGQFLTTGQWQAVAISLGDFAGVNAAAVTKMILGVGDRNAPTAGGAGTFYVDNVRLTKP